jgi:hypothetical protein
MRFQPTVIRETSCIWFLQCCFHFYKFNCDFIMQI